MRTVAIKKLSQVLRVFLLRDLKSNIYSLIFAQKFSLMKSSCLVFPLEVQFYLNTYVIVIKALYLTAFSAF